ncbi:hypothetical protein HanXRQr2_Chr06g0255931 [Helianthus annuus]|uniref:Uncharacterized protein n=1 Tax=Helianthus annuus TaxID=4232 RepID=A0A9K3IS61_HELAN|nr:hypothetical protein HanXRQr2_Chr06g0255931 [Helianthus annuus]KAJ0915190.1 hypothetical protein HanPSC8_Chr06g0247071 [Helianthus annuus]
MVTVYANWWSNTFPLLIFFSNIPFKTTLTYVFHAHSKTNPKIQTDIRSPFFFLKLLVLIAYSCVPSWRICVSSSTHETTEKGGWIV